MTLGDQVNNRTGKSDMFKDLEAELKTDDNGNFGKKEECLGNTQQDVRRKLSDNDKKQEMDRFKNLQGVGSDMISDEYKQ